MNKQELDALRALEQAATPGTWYNDDDTGVHTTYRGEKDRVFGYGYGNQGFICDLADGEYHEYYDANEQRANTEFIAAARNAIPVLLGEIDRLTADLERVTRERDAAVDDLQECSTTFGDCCSYCVGETTPKFCDECVEDGRNHNRHTNWQWRGARRNKHER